MGGNSGGHPGRQRSAGSFAAVRRATGPNNQKAADATTRRRTLSRPCWRAFAHLAFVASCLSPPPCFCTSICAQMWLRLYRFTPGERRARAHRRTAAHDRELGRKVGTMCRRTGRESKRAAEERRGRWKSRPAGERCGDASERRCGSAAARQRCPAPQRAFCLKRRRSSARPAAGRQRSSRQRETEANIFGAAEVHGRDWMSAPERPRGAGCSARATATDALFGPLTSAAMLSHPQAYQNPHLSIPSRSLLFE